MPIASDELSKNALGGTELMKHGLQDRINTNLLEHFHITPSRYRGPMDGKTELYWLHDLPGDPESAHIASGGWNKFEKMIFVSNWQFQQYQQYFDIPWYKCLVLQNAMEPILYKEKSKDKIKIIYHTTPHRGLELLLPVFEKLAEEYDNIELDVFSSFKAYGWEERDKPFEHLFQFCKDHPKINYHGFQPNEVVRAALQEAHIFAYPSIWLETSCIALMEAMSASCLCIHPNYGALPETAANWTWMYQWQQDKRDHAHILYSHLKTAIDNYWTDGVQTKLQGQKSYADVFYSWEYRKHQWESLLQNILEEKGIKFASEQRDSAESENTTTE
jgi:glycosyltransferase involved in cell wall biosynthesis